METGQLGVGRSMLVAYGISDGVSGLEGGWGRLIRMGCAGCDMFAVMSWKWRCLYKLERMMLLLVVVKGNLWRRGCESLWLWLLQRNDTSVRLGRPALD